MGKKKWYEDKPTAWYVGYFAAEEKNREYLLKQIQAMAEMLKNVAVVITAFQSIEKQKEIIIEETTLPEEKK